MNERTRVAEIQRDKSTRYVVEANDTDVFLLYEDCDSRGVWEIDEQAGVALPRELVAHVIAALEQARAVPSKFTP